MGTRRYSAEWLVMMDIEEPRGVTPERRHAYEEDLMLRMHVFAAQISEEFRDHLGTLLDDRTVEHAVITPMPISHPDNTKS